MSMKHKPTIEQVNPFDRCDSVTASLSTLQFTKAKVEYKSERELFVALPDNAISLVANITSDDIKRINIGDSVAIYQDSDMSTYKDNGQCHLYLDMLSKAKAGHIFKGKVIQATPKGLLLTIGGLQSFMPMSHIGTGEARDLQKYVGQDMEVKVIRIKLKEQENNRFLPIVSHKVVEAEHSIVGPNKIKTLKVGDVISGVVKSITHYGVFVTLFPSIDGLIHITDLSWKIISDPTEIVSVGQEISVAVLDIRQEEHSGKYLISLGLKQLSPSPWELMDSTIQVGEIVSGTICGINNYGLLLILECGVRGFIRKAELSWDSQVSPQDYLQGQAISAKIIHLDREHKELLLSIKRMSPDPWVAAVEKIYAVGDILDVIIEDCKKKKVYVKTSDGYSGFIPQSELSWIKRIKRPKEHFEVGEYLTVVVLRIDQENRQIEFSRKRIIPNPWEKYSVNQSVKATIVSIDKTGIYAKLVDDSLPAFIPSNTLLDEPSYEVNNQLNCKIQEIDEPGMKMVLSIE